MKAKVIIVPVCIALNLLELGFNNNFQHKRPK